MLGAGGFLFPDPLYQHTLAMCSRRRGMPVVFDEVAAGMYRLGPCTASDILCVKPDIGVYGKMLR